MGLCQVTVIAAFAVLLQCHVYQARSCGSRRTVVQLRIPGKTNVTLRYPPKVDPVTFNPYPGKLVADCYICSGSSCRKCTKNDLNKPSQSNGSAPVRTNIIIDLKREKPKDSKSESDKSDESDKTGSGDEKPTKHETFVVVQDSATASGASKSVAIEKKDGSGKSVASTATSVAATNSEVIGAFEQDGPTGDSTKTNTENIYVESDSQSNAKSSAESDISSGSNKAPPLAKPTTPAVTSEEEPQQQSPTTPSAKPPATPKVEAPSNSPSPPPKASSGEIPANTPATSSTTPTVEAPSSPTATPAGEPASNQESPATPTAQPSSNPPAPLATSPPAENKDNAGKDSAIAASASKANTEVEDSGKGLESASAESKSAAEAVTSPGAEKEAAFAESAAEAASSIEETPGEDTATANAESEAKALTKANE